MGSLIVTSPDRALSPWHEGDVSVVQRSLAQGHAVHRSATSVAPIYGGGRHGYTMGGQYNPGLSTFKAAEFSSTILAVASSMPPGART